jgi:RNA polymerase sigma-70 factor (ECF subfamily)
METSGSRLRHGPVPEGGAGMKRASAGTAPFRNASQSAPGRGVHTGLRPEDAALLSQLRLGAPAAVESLFDRYHGKVYGLAMSILKNQSDAEEAVQDVFLTVVRKADRFRGNSTLYSWIYRICVNACLIRLRKGRRTETVPIEEFLPAFTRDGVHASPVEDWSREVERRMLNKELGQVIKRISDELSEEYRVVFVLSDVEGLSNEETAKILDLTVPAVKSRLHRSRLYLRERLSRYLRDGRLV